MKIIASLQEMQQFSDSIRSMHQTIAFVPTMGFLHDGHLKLMETGLSHADHLVVSIFVNPAQFGPAEDFSTYPRALEMDLDKCRKIGAAAVFTPRVEEMYPRGFQTYVTLESLPMHLCGLSRPIFFRGVATVVAKLFHIVAPHVAVFGEKDYQQLAVIRRMVQDLSFDIRIIGEPIVREPDGLAMSSRNKYLSPEDRPHALLLSTALSRAKAQVAAGETDTGTLKAQAIAVLNACPAIRVDYVTICDPESLEDLPVIRSRALMAIAVWLGKTRLIDNTLLTASPVV